MRIPMGFVGSARADCSDGSGGASNMVVDTAENEWMDDGCELV